MCSPYTARVLRFCANLSVLFQELPLLERFQAARQGGFDAVEIQFPYELPAQVLRAAAQHAQLPVVLINAPIGPEPRRMGLACRTEEAVRFRSELRRAAEYASVLGVPWVNVLAGRCRPEEQTGALARLEASLHLAVEVLAPSGAHPLLEVINPLDVPGYCMTSFEQAAQLLGRCPGAALQFDIYHAARLGLDPAATLAAMGSLTAHVQFADCPGRHEPGTGTLDFPALFSQIDASDYRGALGAEYLPSGPTAQTLGWLTRARRHARVGPRSADRQ